MQWTARWEPKLKQWSRTGRTGCAAFVTDTSVFSPLLILGFTLSQVYVCILRNPHCLCQRSSQIGISEAISAAELLREPSAPAVSAGGGGDALVTEWNAHPAFLLLPATSHLRPGHTHTSADEPDTCCTPGHMLENRPADKNKMITALILHYKATYKTQPAKCFSKE